MDDLARFLAFERRILAGMSTRVEPFAYGSAYFDEGFPERWFSNFLLADANLEDASAQGLTEAADRILGGAGLRHRLIVVTDDAAGSRLAPGLRAAGYTAEPSLQMVLRRAPDRPAGLPVVECSFAESRPMTEEIYRRERDMPAALIPRFVDQHETWEQAIGARRFVARVDGALAGQCELYVDGSDAQVEFVDTLEEYRGRGVARAVVLGAVEAARDAGAEHVFIMGDDDDWPKELYGRLGFDPMARRWDFTQRPPA
ncbi:MAG: GNAT family N-acetyltransferase [Actinomycetota bacterium]